MTAKKNKIVVAIMLVLNQKIVIVVYNKITTAKKISR